MIYHIEKALIRPDTVWNSILGITHFQNKQAKCRFCIPINKTSTNKIRIINKDTVSSFIYISFYNVNTWHPLTPNKVYTPPDLIHQQDRLAGNALQ